MILSLSLHMNCPQSVRVQIRASSLVATVNLGHVVQSQQVEASQDSESLHDLSNADDTLGSDFLVENTPSRLRTFLSLVSHRLFMSIWNKASKWTRSSTRAAKAYIGKKFTVCLYPVVLEPGALPWFRMQHAGTESLERLHHYSYHGLHRYSLITAPRRSGSPLAERIAHLALNS